MRRSLASTPRGACDDHRGAGAARERSHVDLEFFALVLTRDEARHHARIHRDRIVDHQRDVRILERLHREAAQHLHVCVTAADQHQAVAKRGGHRARVSFALSRTARSRSSIVAAPSSRIATPASARPTSNERGR